ncbi:ODC2-mitochondrial 2-oxodicarboxylate carrier [Mycena kentingensis (nom. inval.)]|nr:ODC2-mitochondrial 2-oxodicarboxylate carrier [Mycena kentingensis (nom. inval.)]
MTATSEKKPLPFIANFAAGAIAGISEILTFYPLGASSSPPRTNANALVQMSEQVKTRMQLDTSKTTQGLVGSFRTIVREEGRVFPPHSPLFINSAPQFRPSVPRSRPAAASRGTEEGGQIVCRLILLPHESESRNNSAANDFWGKTYLAYSGESKMTPTLSILTGCSAGATESFVVVPFELVKIKLQDKSSTFDGPMHVVRHIIKSDGLLGLYAGMESTFWRHVWWNGGYFGCIFQVRAMLPKPETPQATLFNNFVSGAIGGFAGTVLNTPFDVVKSRIQGAARVPGVKPKYNWTYPALVTIFREEGAGALYKGFVPKVLRLAPGGGVLLLVVEGVLGMFRTMLGPPYI